MTGVGMRHYTSHAGRWLPEASSTRDQTASGGTGRRAHSIGESSKDRVGGAEAFRAATSPV